MANKKPTDSPEAIKIGDMKRRQLKQSKMDYAAKMAAEEKAAKAESEAAVKPAAKLRKQQQERSNVAHGKKSDPQPAKE